IIGIGTTADSFVVFFERIKDEIREGRSYRSAVPRGWARARKTILSGNAVTLLAAVVLYVLAIGQVKGFAFTLGLTTILDVVVVFLVTWPLVYLSSKSATLSKPAYNGLGAVQQIARELSNGNGTDKDVVDDTTEAAESTAKEPTSTAVETGSPAPEHGFLYRLYTGTGAVDVVGKRKLWFGISGAFMVIAIVSIAINWFAFGIDFKGGTKVSFPKGEATVQQAEDVFSQALGRDAESVVITGSGATASIQIRTETLDNEESAKLHKALFDKFAPKGPDGKPSINAISDSTVSGTWGSQITNKALWALGVFLVLAGIYIAVRYER
ncbi:Protein translocase subunit SecF, partial [Aduncisulcus paluster]